MIKPTYNYADWLKGKVYLETGAIIKSKTDNPIIVRINDFSANDRKKIELKQKEIFDTKCSEKLTVFINCFKERFKNSEAKEVLLKWELEDNRKFLFLKPVQELHFKNRTFTISKEDLSIMREYMNTQIIKGEKYYGFVHSPNFKFEHKKLTEDLVYARATFDYYNWLLKIQDSKNKSSAISKKDNPAIVESDSKTKERINVKIIALIYFYNSHQITRLNCKEIAAKFNYIEKTSGDGLLQDYLKFSNNTGRVKLNGESKVICNNRLKLINRAINHLKGKAKEHATKDYQNLFTAIALHDW